LVFRNFQDEITKLADSVPELVEFSVAIPSLSARYNCQKLSFHVKTSLCQFEFDSVFEPVESV